MALPNLLNATAIYGRTAYANVTTTLSNVLVNPTSSGNSIKIINCTAANTDTTNIANATLCVSRAGVINYIAVGINVPSRSSIVLLSKDNSLTLEEGDALQMSADANSRIWGTISYEDIA